MNHFATPAFWKCYRSLPDPIQKLADKSFALLSENPRHPSLHLKSVGRYWSARVSLDYRVLAVRDGDDLVWFWIGLHGEYDRLIDK